MKREIANTWHNTILFYNSVSSQAFFTDYDVFSSILMTLTYSLVKYVQAEAKKLSDHQQNLLDRNTKICLMGNSFQNVMINSSTNAIKFELIISYFSFRFSTMLTQ